ncbi:22049_t:CDS:2, partial [Rhizophagus irregularis]
MNGQQSQSRDNRAGEKGIHPPNKNITTTLAQGLLDLDPKSLLNIDLDSIFNPNVTTLQAQGKNDDLDFESYPINPLGVEETGNTLYSSETEYGTNLAFPTKFNAQLNNQNRNGMNFSSPYGLIEAQQSLSNQPFQQQSQNDAQPIVEYSSTWLDDSVQKATDGTHGS